MWPVALVKRGIRRAQPHPLSVALGARVAYGLVVCQVVTFWRLLGNRACMAQKRGSRQGDNQIAMPLGDTLGPDRGRTSAISDLVVSLKETAGSAPSGSPSVNAPVESVGMAPNQRKEEFSRAFLHAVCATAGFDLNKPNVDDDSVDAIISANRKFHRRAPRLDLQLKCTSSFELGEHDFPFRLPSNNYEGLRGADLAAPRILLVVLVPQERAQWIQHSEESTLLQHCGYWHSLRNANEPDDPDQKYIAIRIRRSRLFTVASLQEMMLAIGNGEAP